MPESVRLRFTAPAEENLDALLIYEAASADGPWVTPIETVTAIGSYPDYIDEYTTDQAASKVNCFAIQWRDSKGALTEISNPIQGGTTTLVGEVIQLVEQRDESLDPQVVRQEVETALEIYYGVDPYSLASEASYRIKNGLAKLAQARAMINPSRLVGSNTGWTAGLVSMKSGSDVETDTKMIQMLIDSVSVDLGLRRSRVAQMAEMVIAGGMSEIVSADISRLLIEVE